MSLETPTRNTKDILNSVYKLLDENYKEDEIRLVGIKLSSLVNDKKEQISLFNIEDANETKKEDTIQKTVDLINNKFGKSIVKPASLQLMKENKKK